MPKKLDTQEDTLNWFKLRGAKSRLLDAKLAFAEVSGDLKYAQMIAGRGQPGDKDYIAPVSRIYPSMLPTQASGRWSTARPPLVNFPPDMKHIIVPDDGWWWVVYDLDAVEARLNSLFSKDTEDLEAFNQGWDIHTLTACWAWGHPLPPIRTKAMHKDPSCEEWRNSWTPVWGDGEKDPSDDRRRHLSKTARYAMTYGEDELAILQGKGIEKLGLSRDQILKFGRDYLTRKSGPVARKKSLASKMAMAGIARTLEGRRRILYGDDMKERARVAYSHMVSGTVVDKHDADLIEIDKRFPEAHLVKNGHDSAIWAFPESTPIDSTIQTFKEVVNREVKFEGLSVMLTGSFEWWDSNGQVHRA